MRGMEKPFRLMIVAGEPSGDAHAASLVAALCEEAPGAQFEFFGATGPEMRARGVESVVRSDELAIMGIAEVARVFSRFWRAYAELKRAALERRPDAVVLVDWPEFNLRLARALHRKGLPVIYYISPQLWAWRAYRVRSIRRDVDLLLAILPFEPEWYEERGVKHVEFVGHPLVGQVKSEMTRAEFFARHDLAPARPLISLLPGSRHKELERMLPPMLDAACVIASERRDAQFALVIAPSRKIEEAAPHIEAARKRNALFPATLRVIQHETREALAASNAAAVCSGTATLEAALLQTPLVIVYKESFINWHTLGRLITAEHFGLVNLIAGRRIVTELMQNDLSGKQLAAELLSLLEPECNRAVRASLAEIAAQLGAGGASKRAAELILQFLREPKSQT